MKKATWTATALLGIVGACLSLAACGGGSPASALSPSSTASAQILPVANNPIHNNASAPGLTISSAAVENNVDPATEKAIADCLQLEVKNNSNQVMNSFEIYYRMQDAKTGASEGYYQKLAGLVINPGGASTIYFDNKNGAGHFPENRYSIYRTSQNEVSFTIELSAPGFKPAQAQATKGQGTGEQQD